MRSASGKVVAPCAARPSTGRLDIIPALWSPFGAGAEGAGRRAPCWSGLCWSGKRGTGGQNVAAACCRWQPLRVPARSRRSDRRPRMHCRPARRPDSAAGVPRARRGWLCVCVATGTSVMPPGLAAACLPTLANCLTLRASPGRSTPRRATGVGSRSCGCVRVRVRGVGRMRPLHGGLAVCAGEIDAVLPLVAAAHAGCFNAATGLADQVCSRAAAVQVTVMFIHIDVYIAFQSDSKIAPPSSPLTRAHNATQQPTDAITYSPMSYWKPFADRQARFQTSSGGREVGFAFDPGHGRHVRRNCGQCQCLTISSIFSQGIGSTQ